MKKQIFFLLCLMPFLLIRAEEDSGRQAIYVAREALQNELRGVCRTIDEIETVLSETSGHMESINLNAYATGSSAVALGAVCLKKYKKLRIIGVALPLAYLGVITAGKISFGYLKALHDELQNRKRFLEQELKEISILEQELREIFKR